MTAGMYAMASMMPGEKYLKRAKLSFWKKWIPLTSKEKDILFAIYDSDMQFAHLSAALIPTLENFDEEDNAEEEDNNILTTIPYPGGKKDTYRRHDLATIAFGKYSFDDLINLTKPEKSQNRKILRYFYKQVGNSFYLIWNLIRKGYLIEAFSPERYIHLTEKAYSFLEKHFEANKIYFWEKELVEILNETDLVCISSNLTHKSEYLRKTAKHILNIHKKVTQKEN